jgi:hypothetical protein
LTEAYPHIHTLRAELCGPALCRRRGREERNKDNAEEMKKGKTEEGVRIIRKIEEEKKHN